MPRPSTKEDLIKQADENFEKLMDLIEERGEQLCAELKTKMLAMF